MGYKRPYQTFLLEDPEEFDHCLYQTGLRRNEPRAKVRRSTQPYTSGLLPHNIYPELLTERVTVVAKRVLKEKADHDSEALCDVSGHWLFENDVDEGADDDDEALCDVSGHWLFENGAEDEAEDDHEGWWDLLWPELFDEVVEDDCAWDSEGWSNWTPPSSSACTRRSSLVSSRRSSAVSSVEESSCAEEEEEEGEEEVANEAADSTDQQPPAVERDRDDEALQRWTAMHLLFTLVVHIEQYRVGREAWLEWNSWALILVMGVHTLFVWVERDDDDEAWLRWSAARLLGWAAAAVLLTVVVHCLSVWLLPLIASLSARVALR